MRGNQDMVEAGNVFVALTNQLLLFRSGEEHYNTISHSGDGVAGLVFTLRIQMDYFDYHPDNGNHKMGYGAESTDFFVHILVYGHHRTFACFSKEESWYDTNLKDWKFLTTHDAQWRDSIRDYIKNSIEAAQEVVLKNVPYKVREKFGDHVLTDCLLSFGMANSSIYYWVRADDESNKQSRHPHDRELVMLKPFEYRGDPKNIMPPWDSNTVMSDDMIENQLKQLSSQLEGEDDEGKKKVLLDTIQDMQSIMEKRVQYRNELGYLQNHR